MAALSGVPGPANASHSWRDYHWARTSNPFTVRLGDNVTGAWDSYLATTSADWSVSSVLDTRVVAGRTTGHTCRRTSGRVEICSAKYGETGWLGFAQVSVSGRHITAGTAKLNDTYFNKWRYNKASWRNHVMCQEVGHTFGLAHVNENLSDRNTGSCMDYTNRPAGTSTMPSNEHPNDHDHAQLETIYTHLDATSTVSQSSASSSAGTGREAWGRLVASANGGRTQTFVREFGRGLKVVTHVVWAVGYEDGTPHSHE